MTAAGGTKGGVLDPASYTADTTQTPPGAGTPPNPRAVLDWPTPFDFDILIGQNVVANRPTAVQFMLLDPHLDFYFPYNSKQNNSSNDPSQAVAVDHNHVGSFHCPTISIVTDATNNIVGKTLQFFIDADLTTNHPASGQPSVPPSVNLNVVWETPILHPDTFLPIAIDPHPTNNGVN